MAASDAQIAEVQRMCALTDADTTWTPTVVQTYIERYPLLDERGEEPYTWVLAAPPTQHANPEWIATYDLHHAAADIWSEKAAALVDMFNVSTDGSQLNRKELYDNAMKQVAFHLSRRAVKTWTAHKWPEEYDRQKFPSYVINLPEESDD